MKSIGFINILVYTILLNVSAFADADKTKYFDVDGEIRLGFVSQDNDANPDNKNGAIGGSLGIKTKAINGIELGAKFYTTNMLKSKNGDGSGTSLFSSTEKGYSILGEAYVKGTLNNTSLKIGRQRLDTPYANDNDIRMVPNLFEAARLSNTDIPDTTLLAIHIKRAAGVDSPIQEGFTDIVAGYDGATILGIKYDGITNSKLSAWYNNIDRLAAIVHLEAYNSIKFNNNSVLDLGLQYANYKEKASSGTDGSMYGVCANYKVDDIQLYAAYNKTSNDTGKSLSNVFGGGRPYMTSMDTQTLNGLSDAKAYRLGLGYDILSNLNISYYYGDFKYQPLIDGQIVEQNIYANYRLNDNVSALFIYTDTKHTKANIVQGDSYKRIRGTIKYVF